MEHYNQILRLITIQLLVVIHFTLILLVIRILLLEAVLNCTNTTGANNIAIGYNPLNSNTTGNNNVAIGYDALGNNTTGSDNVAIGYQAGYSGSVK